MAIKLNMTPFCLSYLLTAEKLLIREFTAFLSVTFAQNVVLFFVVNENMDKHRKPA